MRVDGRSGQPQSWMIPMASILWGFVPTMERYSVQQTESKSVLPTVRYGSEGRRTKRTTSKLDDSYGFHTVGFLPTMERYSVQQTESKSVLPTVRYGSEGRRTKRTTSKLDDSYGFHTMGFCTYDGEVQRATNGIEIRTSYGEIWK